MIHSLCSDQVGSLIFAENAGAGKATITLSFDAWKGVTVGSTTHTLTVLPLLAGPKPEPIPAKQRARRQCRLAQRLHAKEGFERVRPPKEPLPIRETKIVGRTRPSSELTDKRARRRAAEARPKASCLRNAYIVRLHGGQD